MILHAHRSSTGSSIAVDPARQAFLLLRTAFTVAPIVFGLDKFTNLLTDWPNYLAPWIDVAFGTYERPTGPETYALGVREPAPRGYLALLQQASQAAELLDRRGLGGFGWVVRPVGIPDPMLGS